jgi:hypothetical protein
MKSSLYKISVLTFGMCFLAFISLAQQNSKPNERFARLDSKKAHILNSIFPVDDIVSITVTNYNGIHKLTPKELAFLKEQLKKAKWAGGLLVKPGHITMRMQLKTNTAAKIGEVYPTQGSIHFEGAVNKFGEPFMGTYHLPLAVNFDNYK